MQKPLDMTDSELIKELRTESIMLVAQLNDIMKLIFLSKEFRMHVRINERAHLHSRYMHERVCEIVNNAVYRRKDETNLLKWKTKNKEKQIF